MAKKVKAYTDKSERLLMKLLFKLIFIFYLAMLTWLVIFKFSTDIGEVLHYGMRSYNLIPFAGSQFHLREVFDNFIIFIPFGLLLSVTFKRTSILRKFMYITLFSAGVEIIQFVLAIGVTDITDVIANSVGGLLGLGLYTAINKYIETDKQDRFISIICLVLLVALLVFRLLFLRVRY